MALQVISKVNQRVKFISRCSKFLNREALEILAGALIQCHFDYACSSWYTGLNTVLKNKLQTSQNKLVRVVLKLHPRTHLLPTHFNSLKWLRVEERVSLVKLCMVHKIQNKVAPRYFENYFSKVSENHNHFTRRSTTDLILVNFSSNIGKNSFLYSAAATVSGMRYPKRLKR